MRNVTPLWKHLKTAAAVCALAGLAQAALAEDSKTATDGASPTTSTEWQADYHSAGNRSASTMEAFREGPTGGIWQRAQLLGDPFGIRSAMGKYGLSVSIVETSEDLGNVTGGTRKSFDYDGLTTIDLQMDTQRAFGLRDGLFNVSGLWMHGQNLSANNLASLQTSSGIESDDAFRMWELWYDQGFDFRQYDVKIGVQSLDQEFIYSQYAGLFVNTMFGWPMVPSADLIGGGPAYPLASLGVRFRAQPNGTPWGGLIGVFDDNPSGLPSPNTGGLDSQKLDAHGTNFRYGDKPLVMAEIQYSRPAVGEMEYPGDEGGTLPGAYKLGFWYDWGNFADQHYDADGQPLDDNGDNPRMHSGNYSVYAVVDQLLWRRSPESPEGIGFFLRAMGAPPDRNLISFSLNSGLTWRAPFKHREYDVAGLGMGWAQISNQAIGSDRDTGAVPVRSSETFVEATYQFQVVPWWSLQPDVQYIFTPGGGVQDADNDPNTRVGDEMVVGLRTNVSF